MKKLFFLLLAILISGHVFAQAPSSHQLEIDKWRSSYAAYWDTKVDATAEWGKWLMTTRPYWDQIFEAQMKNSAALVGAIDSFEPSATEDNVKRMDAAMSAVMEDFHKVMQGITPPEELKALHAIMLEESALIATSNEQNRDQVKAKAEKLGEDLQKEQDKVFQQHGVPQNIIDGFLKE